VNFVTSDRRIERQHLTPAAQQKSRKNFSSYRKKLTKTGYVAGITEVTGRKNFFRDGLATFLGNSGVISTA
jgi:hypothetical protein